MESDEPTRQPADNGKAFIKCLKVEVVYLADYETFDG